MFEWKQLSNLRDAAGRRATAGRLRAPKFSRFTAKQRALTAAGLAPAILLGCAVHEHGLAGLAVPVSTYRVSMPVPQAEAAPVQAPVPSPPKALESVIQSAVRNFKGVAGVAVTSVDERWMASANGDLHLPQQSVSKLWVAMTVLDQVDRGKLSLEMPLTITRADFTLFHQPIAALVTDDKPYRTTVGEVMRRALTMSDNTCNDKLLRLVGGPQVVRDFISRKQLGSIRFGPGEKLLQSGTAGLTWNPKFSMSGEFQRARAALPRDVRLVAFNNYVSNPPDGAEPVAIAGALAKLKRGELLSPTATAWLIGTMEKSHTGKQRMRGAVPPGWEFGHKTGTGQDLFGHTAGYNDVGLLTAPDGKSYAVAIMIGDTSLPIPARQELMHTVVAAIVADHRK